MKALAISHMIIVSLALALSASTLEAQERGTMGDKGISMLIKQEVVKLEDVDGHILVFSESKRYDLNAGSVTIVNGTADLVKGNGIARNYFKHREVDGDTLIGKGEGTVTTTVSDGKPTTTSNGKWFSTHGTGKWQNRQAAGTFKSKAVADGVNIVEWEGTWELKR